MSLAAPSREPDRRRRSRWIGRGIAIALVAALGAGAWSLARFDTDPPDDADLLVDLSPIPDAENGWPIFAEVAGMAPAVPARWITEFQKLPCVDAADGSLVPERADTWPDSAVAKEWPAIAGPLEPTIEALRTALEAPRFASGEAFHAPAVTPVRVAETFLAHRGRVALLEGRPEDAIDGAVLLLEWGAHWSRSARSLIEGMLARRVRGVGELLASEVAGSPHATADHLERLATALRDNPIDSGLDARTTRAEYTYLRTGWTTGWNDVPSGIEPTWRLKPHLTLRLLEAELRAWLPEIDAPFLEIEQRTRPRSGLTLPAWNTHGLTAFDSQVSAWWSALQSSSLNEFQTAATDLVVAAARYRLDHGALPETPDLVVPTYLDAVPRDPYDGKPLRYDPVKRVVWSVGGDGIDSGGDPGGGLAQDEPTLSIPVPPGD